MKIVQKPALSQSILRPVVPQAKPYIPREDHVALMQCFKEILDSKTLINGRFTEEFEHETAKSVGVRHAVSLNSCTSALNAILEYIEVRDKKVLVPVNTFIATSNAVIFAGGTPSLVDMGEDLQMDFEKMKASVDSDTKAVILVHIAGYIHPRVEDFKRFCDEKSIYLIEDAAHAHGSSLGGKRAGSFGFAGAFSYYASKVIATGVGGMLVTNDDELAARARSLRFHGEDHTRGVQNRIGSDWLMTEFQAALGLSQLRRLSESIDRRMHIAGVYDKELSAMNGVTIFPLEAGAVGSYYKYPVRLSRPLEKTRVKERLERAGISVGNAYWPPIHLQPAYKEKFGYKEGDFPVAERVLQSVLTLPLYAGMTDEEVMFVVDGFRHAALA